ncbi:MAG: PEP-CTERM sorting domain-containing protein [Sphingobacteriaceae bacterium]|nr:MAG: PEP-CTERM sorting domain-containing protein [Sphingobacteriaceae bacterium]
MSSARRISIPEPASLLSLCIGMCFILIRDLQTILIKEADQ